MMITNLPVSPEDGTAIANNSLAFCLFPAATLPFRLANLPLAPYVVLHLRLEASENQV